MCVCVWPWRQRYRSLGSEKESLKTVFKVFMFFHLLSRHFLRFELESRCSGGNVLVDAMRRHPVDNAGGSIADPQLVSSHAATGLTHRTLALILMSRKNQWRAEERVVGRCRHGGNSGAATVLVSDLHGACPGRHRPTRLHCRCDVVQRYYASL